MIASLVCIPAAIAASVFFGLRAEMLRPNLKTWPEAPLCVHRASAVMAALFGAYTVAVIDGYRPSTAEVVFVPAFAVYALLMWLNLHRQATPKAPAEA